MITIKPRHWRTDSAATSRADDLDRKAFETEQDLGRNLRDIVEFRSNINVPSASVSRITTNKDVQNHEALAPYTDGSVIRAFAYMQAIDGVWHVVVQNSSTTDVYNGPVIVKFLARR